jgi:tetratricopeptide (TPR) repeat protein
LNPADPLAALASLLTGQGRWPASSPGNARFVAASLYPDLETEPLADPVRVELASTAGRARLLVAGVLSEYLAPRAALGWLAAEPAQAVQPLRELATIRAEMAAGNKRDAVDRLDALSRSEAGSGLVGPWIQAAIFAAARNDPAAAQAALGRALAVAPGSPRLRMLAGDLQLVLGQPARAVAEYRLALAHWPQDPRLLNQLAHALAQAGAKEQYVQALGYVETALGRQPHYLLRAALLDTRADLLVRLGRNSEALVAYRELSTTVGGMTTPEQWHRLGDLALEAGDSALARTAYEEALDYGRDYPGRAAAERQLRAAGAGPPRK